MKKKLMTWEKFEEKFKPLADKWEDDEDDDLSIEYEKCKWWITLEMKPFFGTEIEIEEIDDRDYTHYGNEYYWHKSWFEPDFIEIEFIKENEFVI